jgi:hypothetical protein
MQASSARGHCEHSMSIRQIRFDEALRSTGFFLKHSHHKLLQYEPI